jgi:hypothetical protein
MRKSNKYWWSQLSHKQKKRVKANPETLLCFKFRNPSFKWFISGLFNWERTNEGYNYWEGISKKNIK